MCTTHNVLLHARQSTWLAKVAKWRIPFQIMAMSACVVTHQCYQLGWNLADVSLLNTGNTGTMNILFIVVLCVSPRRRETFVYPSRYFSFSNPTALMMTLAILWSLFSRSREDDAPGGSTIASRTPLMSRQPYLFFGSGWVRRCISLVLVRGTDVPEKKYYRMS